MIGKQGNRRLFWIISLALMAGTMVVFAQVLRCEFLNYDDEAYITDNPRVQAGPTPAGIAWALTTMRAGNWHPLTWISHMLDCRIYGWHPWGHHLSSLLIHSANAMLLFLVLARMTGAVWKSGFVAALFAVHPLHVESVAWIAERKDMLSTLFLILTVWAYVRYAEYPSLKLYVPVIVLFTLGLLSKPMLVTLPFVLLLLDYWPLGRTGLARRWLPVTQWRRGEASAYQDGTSDRDAGRSFTRFVTGRRLILEKLPLLSLALGSCVITYVAQHAGGAVASFERMTLGARIANALVAYVSYVIGMVWPRALAVLYPHPGNSLPVWHVIGSVFLLTTVTWMAIGASRSRPYLAVGWLWYVGTLVPVLGLVQIGVQAMADRYTYVPLIGIFVVIAWGAPEVIGCPRGNGSWLTDDRQRRVGPSTINHQPPTILPFAAFVTLAALTACTCVQLGYWKDSRALFSHALAVTDGNYLAHQNLGVALFHEGETDSASEQFRAALEAKADYAPAHNGLGVALRCRGMDDEAIEHFHAALRLDPRLEDASNNLAAMFYLRGRYAEAWSEIDKCRRHGGVPDPELVRLLAEKLPNP